MKKITSIILILTMMAAALSLTACSGGAQNSSLKEATLGTDKQIKSKGETLVANQQNDGSLRSTDTVKNQKELLRQAVDEAVKQQNTEKEFVGYDGFAYKDYEFTVDKLGDVYCYASRSDDEGKIYTTIFIETTVTVKGIYFSSKTDDTQSSGTYVAFATMSYVSVADDGKLAYREVGYSRLYSPEKAIEQHFNGGSVAKLEATDVVKIDW